LSGTTWDAVPPKEKINLKGFLMKRIFLAFACFLTAAVGFAQAPNSTTGGSHSLWSTSTTPAIPAFGDPSAYELGVKFYSDSSGFISAIRFYKGPGNTGTHIAHLWDSQGNLLSTATFTNETASGWQQVTLPNPVPITAGKVYVASYWDPSGQYALNRPYFGSQYNNPPLHALANGADGANGIYVYGSSSFPTATYDSSNYWVDVVFTPGPTTSQKESTGGSGSASATAPTLSSISPTLGPVSGGTMVTLTGSNFADGATVSFGSAGASSVTFISATELEAVSPPGSAGNASVVVTNPGGQSASLANAFIYSSGPTVTSVSPNSGSASGGTTVTITGSGFESGAMVAFGVTAATSVTVLSSTEIQAVTPTEPAGSESVTVTNPDSGMGSLPSAFQFASASVGGLQPQITAATTDPGAANSSATCVNQLPVGATAMCTLTITGLNFQSGATVTLGAAGAATNVNVVNSTTITATVPTYGTPETYVNITVTNPGGLSSTLSNGFFYGKIYAENDFSSGLNGWSQQGTGGSGSCVASSSGTCLPGTLQSDNGTNLAACPNPTPMYSGSYVDCQYYLLPANTGENADNNIQLSVTTPQLTHFFMRTFVYYPTPIEQSATAGVYARKLFYVNPAAGAGYPSCILGWGPGADPGMTDTTDCGNTSSQPVTAIQYGSTVLAHNQWYEAELEVQRNSYSDSQPTFDGWINVWMNGTLSVAVSNLDVCGADGGNGYGCSNGFYNFTFGAQIDTTTGSSPWEEYRYLYGPVVADAYIP
jgi:Domain of unknown function (DUF4082)/IPT/TIG domain